MHTIITTDCLQCFKIVSMETNTSEIRAEFTTTLFEENIVLMEIILYKLIILVK